MKTLLLLIFSATCLAGQSNDRNYELSRYSAGTGIASYHWSGFTGLAISPASGISEANPASISIFKELAVGISFKYSSEFNLIGYPGLYYPYKRANVWLPASFGLILPAGNVSFALTYHQKYNSLEGVTINGIHTVGNPEGTDDILKLTYENMVHSPAFVCSYSLNNFTSDSDVLAFGVQVFYDYTSITHNLADTESKLRSGRFNWKFGALYKRNDGISAGVIYEKGVDMEDELEINSANNLLINDPDNGISFVAVKQNMRVRLPGKFAAGLSMMAGNNVELSFAVSSINWSDAHDAFKTQLTMSAGTVISLSEFVKLSCGFYNSAMYYNKDVSTYYNQSRNNNSFISAGVELKSDRFVARCEVMDNHMLPIEHGFRTLTKLAVDYRL